MWKFAVFAQIILRLKLYCSILKDPSVFCLKTDHLNMTDFQNCFSRSSFISQIWRDFQHFNEFFLTAEDKYQIACLFFLKCPTENTTVLKYINKTKQNLTSQTPWTCLYEVKFKLLWTFLMLLSLSLINKSLQNHRYKMMIRLNFWP